MITLLRKIRKKLISQNNLSSYLLYAIGEILLVVIGILLAVQINTWNNNRIDRKLEKIYLKRLVQDLKSDEQELQYVIELAYHRLLLSEKIIDTLNGNSIANMSFYQMAQENFPDTAEIMALPFGSTLTRIRMYGQFYGTQVTFQELLANGKLDIISNSTLKENIQHHYNRLQSKLHLQRAIAKARDEFVSFLIAQGIEMETKQSYTELQAYLNKGNQLLAHLRNITGLATASLNALLISKDSVKKSTEQLIGEIEHYLQELN